ncbi:MAG: polysaccharide deacetylase [Rhodobacterales bacterium 32-66-7]|nr:MAG: polysaccharide deacetylase [Rhodobacterales bacterium 12-65-15]OYX25294.1 MAG: polysaccharide deacetylase [Rhodobacterales bacterium 32-66-7]
MSQALRNALDRCAEAGRPARLWLRDDDAVDPTPALERLLRLTDTVPVTLAVIPAASGQALADRLAEADRVTVAVHGWSHANHAGTEEKKQELGPHRPVSAVVADLGRGFRQLATLHGPRFAPVLVPPWNRIATEVAAALPAVGFRALSVFGPEKPAPLPVINTHVDPVDWHGTRSARPLPGVMDDLAQAVGRGGAVGVLTHHLIHDAALWRLLEHLLELTRDHPGCRWVSLPDLMSAG